jgi:cytidylate kinase
MSRIFQNIPIEKQITKHMQRWEMVRAEWARQARPSLQPVPQKFGPYITISRERGSGGREMSQRLAEKLGWHLFDREIIEAIASRTHAREELVARFDEHRQSAMDTYLRNLFTGQRFDNTQYLCHLSQVVLSLAQYGKAVILGRGANYILPAEAGLRVRVTAPLELRRRRLMQELECDGKKALQEINTHDKERRDFLQHHFHMHADDACAYDMTINTAQIEVETATDLIIKLAEAKLKPLSL